MAEHGLASAIKLASNESPFGPLPGVAEAVAAAVRDVNRYPDHTAEALRERFAAHVGVDPQRVAAGPGSVGLLEQLALAYVDHGDEVVYPWPSFIAYPQFTRLAGGAESTVPLRRQAFDAEAIVAAISERTRVVLIANPNNPTSTALRTADLHANRRRRARRLPRRRSTRPTASSSPAPTSPTPSSCSATARTSPCCARCRRPTGWPACVSGSSSPTRPSSMPSTRARSRSGSTPRRRPRRSPPSTNRPRCPGGAPSSPPSARVAQALRRRGLGVPASEANFWWLPAGDRAAELGRALERRGVVTRPLGRRHPRHDRRLRGQRPLRRSARRRHRRRAGARPRIGSRRPGRPPSPPPTGSTGWTPPSPGSASTSPIDHPGRTDPVPGEDETWDDRQVWAHVAEFGDYWLAELTALLAGESDEPQPFGRTRRDAGTHRRHRVRPTRHAVASTSARSNAPPTASLRCWPE